QIEAKGLKLEVLAAPGLPEILGDRAQLQRVLVNLITNALRATAAGGAITVRVSQHGANIDFAVTDTGIGIPRDYLTRIFEPFANPPNSPGGGSGLGLTISRRLVEAHHGRLTVQSDLGRGATFTVTIPVHSRAGLAPASSEAHA